jgi:UDP-3-O-[3-hydroxymyristoyl] glucosamine N-acyltransferase
MRRTLAELAERCQAVLRGDPAWHVDHVSGIDTAGPDSLVFVANESYLDQLSACRAGVVVLGQQYEDRFTGNVLISSNPRLTYTRAAILLHPNDVAIPGCHPTAIVDPGATVHPTASIGAHVVVERGAVVGANTFIGPASYIGRDVSLGTDCLLHPRVTVEHRCVVGDRCILHPGVVIGSDGFGYAKDGQHWEKTPQLGRVIVGDDVEIGANTTIDRGALGDTTLGRGVKLDNLIQIAHNVEIGDDTAIAACVGIAGSTRIGKRCTIAGQVGIVGHIEITDDVHVTGATVVSHTIRQPGTYSSGTPLETYQSWLKNAVRMRQLDDMARRLRALEKKITERSRGGTSEES